MQVSDDHLRGRTVIAADGQAIGEVAALFIDTSKWVIVAVQIKLSKSAAEQLGASRGLLRAATLDLPVRLIQSVGDAILLTVPTVELRQNLAETGERQEQQS
jgi:sporulation protein YlmC with PRC-barrel domain